MRVVQVVAGNQLRAHWQSLLIAGAMGFFPLLAVLLPHVSAEVRPQAAQGLCAGYLLVGAIAEGLRLFSSDLLSPRMGFYWTRPVKLSALFAGQFVGAVATLLISAALVLLPTALVMPKTLPPVFGFVGLTVLAGSLCLLTLTAVFTTLLRLASAALAADFLMFAAVALTATAATVRWSFAIDVGALSFRSTMLNVVLVFLAVTVVALVALFVAIDRGRSNGKVVHATLSLLFWPPLLALAAICVKMPEKWIRTGPSERDARTGGLLAIGPSGWMVNTVTRKNGAFFKAVVRNVTTSQSRDIMLSFENGGQYLHNILPAREQPRMGVVWITRDLFGQKQSQMTLVMEDIATGSVVGNPVTLPVSSKERALIAVDPQGTRVAVAYGNRIWTVDVQDKRVGHADLPADGGGAWRVVFVSSDVVRVYRRDRKQMAVHDCDVRTGNVTPGGVVTADEMVISSDGSRVFARQDQRLFWTTGDGLRELGAVEAESTDNAEQTEHVVAAALLPGDKVVRVVRRNDRLVARGGRADVDVGVANGSEKVTFGPRRPLEGHVLLTLLHEKRTQMWDPQTGTVTPLSEPGTMAFDGFSSPLTVVSSDQADPRALVFVHAKGSGCRVDPTTHACTPL